MISGPGLFLLLIEGYLVHFILPFLFGFIPAYIFISPHLTHKSGKIYIKSKSKRIIIAILIALICGFLSYAILATLLGIVSRNVQLI
jgi:hypothetical protein